MIHRSTLGTCLRRLWPLLAVAAWSAPVQAQLIDTWLGRGAYTTPVAATAANMIPWPITVASANAASFPLSVYFADHNGVYRYDPQPKTVTLVAGTDTVGCNGNGITATTAQMGTVSGLALDTSGNLYVADYGCGQIWKVTTSGLISALPTGFAGAAPYYLHVDALSGALLVADFNIGVYTINLSTGAVTLLPQIGNLTLPSYLYPEAITSDSAGNLYVIATQFGVPNYLGFAGYATAPDVLYQQTPAGVVTPLATLGYCSEGLAIDANNNLYTADYCYNNIYQYAPSTGKVTAVAGTGSTNNGGYSPDGTLANKAHLGDPADVAVDSSGTIYFTDFSNWQVRKFTLGGKLTTLVGNEDGVGGPATMAAQFGRPLGCLLAVDPSGNLYSNPLVVSSTGTLSLFTGRGNPGFSGDGGPAKQALTTGLDCMATDALGNVYLADGWNNRIRKIDTKGIISTIAGTGSQGFSTSGPALAAAISNPGPIAVDANGNVYFGERLGFSWFPYGSHAIFKLASNGVLSLVAGGAGFGGYGGDGGPATSAVLNSVESLAFDSLGNLYLADTGNHRIRKIDLNGMITTVAGTGTPGFSGDGGPASAAQLNSPFAIVVDSAGDLFITDAGNHRVRKVSASTGTISTTAGTGVAGFSGDGSVATLAALNFPTSMAIDPSGTLYVMDSHNNRIRRIRGANDTTPPVVTATLTPAANSNGWNNANVAVRWSASDAQSGIQSSSGCSSATVTVDTAGTNFSCTATSVGGTTTKSVTVRRDTVAPASTITAPAALTYARGTTLFAAYACQDNLSGIASCTGSVTNGALIATSKAGTFTFKVTATDKAGNAATKSVTYTIH